VLLTVLGSTGICSIRVHYPQIILKFLQDSLRKSLCLSR